MSLHDPMVRVRVGNRVAAIFLFEALCNGLYLGERRPLPLIRSIALAKSLFNTRVIA